MAHKHVLNSTPFGEKCEGRPKQKLSSKSNLGTIGALRCFSPARIHVRCLGPHALGNRLSQAELPSNGRDFLAPLRNWLLLTMLQRKSSAIAMGISPEPQTNGCRDPSFSLCHLPLLVPTPAALLSLAAVEGGRDFKYLECPKRPVL